MVAAACLLPDCLMTASRSRTKKGYRRQENTNPDAAAATAGWTGKEKGTPSTGMGTAAQATMWKPRKRGDGLVVRPHC